MNARIWALVAMGAGFLGACDGTCPTAGLGKVTVKVTGLPAGASGVMVNMDGPDSFHTTPPSWTKPSVAARGR